MAKIIIRDTVVTTIPGLIEPLLLLNRRIESGAAILELDKKQKTKKKTRLV